MTPYWTQAIQNAHANGGRFTWEDKGKALDWVTCACGEQDKDIERREDGSPWDQKLRDLGNVFARAVDNDLPGDASCILDKIELRAAELLVP